MDAYSLNLLDHLEAGFALFKIVTEETGEQDLVVLFSNQFYAAKVGLTPETILGRRFSRIIPHDVAWIPLFAEVAWQKRDTYSFESFMVDHDFHAHAQIFSPEYGKVAVIMHDRSRFIQDEMVREREERGTRRLIATMPEGLCYGKVLFSADGAAVDVKCVIVNDSFERIMGVRSGSLQGNCFFAMYPTVFTEDLRQIDKAMQTKQNVTFIRDGLGGCILEIGLYPQESNLLVVVVRNVTERVKAERELEAIHQNMLNSIDYKHAELDEQTGLYHCYAIETKCRCFLRENKTQQPAALVEIDVEGFKYVYDNYGRIKRDELLKQVSEILKREFAKNDAVIGFIGGYGFLAFFPQCDSTAFVCQETERICEKISRLIGAAYDIVASAGIAFFPQDGADYERLYQCTDAALFHAKRLGKNHCMAYEASMKVRSGADMLTVSREWLLDEANDIIYVSDMDTYELLYMNSNLKKLFHQDDNYKGRKCYEVLQGFDSPCKFCTNPLLSQDEFYHWTYYNPVIGQSLILKDRIVNWYGRPARIEFAADVTELDTLRKKAEEQNRMILSSIDYASKIQQNLLPRAQDYRSAFSDFSVIWKPRDIVGGDIYWIRVFARGTVLCVCDCTGHGTPGALLTMLVSSALDDYVNESNCFDPAGVLWNLDQKLVSVFSRQQNADRCQNKDGCDLAVLFIAKDGSVAISAAHTHVYICDGREVTQLKGQHIFIGEGGIGDKNAIKVVRIAANPDNKFYIATDGLSDQPGGPNDRPYGYGNFKRIILEHHAECQAVISHRIWNAFEAWRGDAARVDDVELISFKL